MKKLEFDPAIPLYDQSTHGWRMDQCAELFDQLHARGKPIVVFVHGRGKEPNKSLFGATLVQGLAVPKIALGYDVSVAMFSWDSAFPGLWFNNRKRALAHVPAAAESLATLVASLRGYYSTRPGLARPVLFVHSMGSIVLQRTVEKGALPQAERLFTRVVLSEPDADDVGHATWLEPLSRVEEVYATFNRDDRVLRRSTKNRPEGRHALGLGTTEPLARSCRYIDLSNMGAVGSDKDEDHEVFSKAAMNGQLYVCQFFEQALRGLPFLLDPAQNVETIDREVVYRLKNKDAPDAPCLKAPHLPKY